MVNCTRSSAVAESRDLATLRVIEYFDKTTEMIINTSHCNFLDKLSVADVEIERVNVLKLLGVHINQSLKWDDHVSAICNKAASRIYYLKQLKCSSVDPGDLYHFTLLLSDHS